jgi:hypothetical protein
MADEDEHACTLYEIACLFCLIEAGSARLRRMLCDYVDASEATGRGAKQLNRMMRVVNARRVDDEDAGEVLGQLREWFDRQMALAGGDHDSVAAADGAKREILRGWCDTAVGACANESSPASQCQRRARD